MLTCPVCDAEIDVEEDEIDEGDVVTCEECGADLKVISVEPLELEPLEEEEEDEDAGELEEDEDEESWR